jgi:hypothetical protein
MSSGDIWSTGAFAFESPLKDLLETQNYTLEDLLAEDELLQELRGLHPTLVSYFSKEENVTGLIRYLVNPPITFQDFLFSKATQKESENKKESHGDTSDESKDTKSSVDDTSQSGWLLEKTSEAIHEKVDEELNPREEFENISIRYPYMACEVICCEIFNVIDIILNGYVRSHKGTEHEQQNESHETILDLLFSMLFTTPQYQLDDRRAGYLEKILSMLFRTRRDAMTAYINGDHLKETAGLECKEQADTVPNHRGGGEALLKALFRQLHSNSITQIVQHMFMPRPETFESGDDGHIVDKHHDEYPSDDSDEMGSDLDYFCGINCNWADSSIGVQLLLDGLFVDEGDHSEAQLNASQHSSEILTLVIQHSQLDSNIMKTLVSEPILSKLIQSACGADDSNLSPPTTFKMHESTMTTAMNVLEIFILQLGGYGTVPSEQQESEQKVRENDSDSNLDPKVVKATVANINHEEQSEQMKLEVAQSLISYLPSFLACLSQLLSHQDTLKWTSPCQFSKVEQPMLGSSRLRIVRLIESLVLLSIREVDLLLCGSDCLQICLDLFWKFPWCSMLHQSVANLLVHVLEGGEDRIDLQMYFLTRCNLPRLLMDSFLNPSFSSYLNTESSDSCSVSRTNLPDESDSRHNNLGATGKVEPGTIPVMKEDAEESTAEQSHRDRTKERNSTEHCRKELSFRLGYMGHVIIICQALVHACEEEEPSEMTETEAVSECEAKQEDQERDHFPYSNRKNITLNLLQGMSCYSDWLTFVNTTLASETAVQSTPLGGYYDVQADNNGDMVTESTWNTASEFDDAENELGHGHPYIVGNEEIDLDDTDLDIAASMMESMNLPGSEENGKSQGHRRQRGVISGQDLSKGSSFGAVVDIYKASTDYVFDDPLGSQNQFDIDNDDIKGENNNDVDEDEAPIMDLFAGNFELPCDDQNIDTGWANFDDAFTDVTPFSDVQTSVKNDAHEYIGNDDGNDGSSSEDESEENQ